MNSTYLTELHKDRNEIIGFCERSRRIYLYGTGMVSDLFYHYLSEEKIDINGYIVSNGHKETDQHNGYKVLELREFEFCEDMGIILSVGGKYQKEILEELRKMSIPVETNVLRQKVYCAEEDENISLDDAYVGAAPNGSFFEDYIELDKIGLETGTDKNSLQHNYLRKYEFFIKKFKNEDIRLVELGIYYGDSLKMWERYFPNAEIVGVDINSACKQYESNRTKVEVCDLGSIENLSQIGKTYSPHIIVDDASHMWSHQIKALVILFPYIESGGIYIVEDIGTSFWKYKDSSFADATISGYDFLRKLADRVAGRIIEKQSEPSSNIEKEVVRLAKMIDMITFIFGSAIIIKK